MDENEDFESENVDTLFFTGSSASEQKENSYLNEQFTYKQVGSIAKYVEPISSLSSMDVVVEMFKRDDDLQALPVEEYDHVVGIIDRRTVLKATDSAWKRLTSGSVIDYTPRVEAIIYANEFIEKALPEVSKINHEYGIEYFPVFDGRNFFGIVRLDEFLARMTDIREKDLDKASQIQTAQFATAEELASLPYKVNVWNRMANTLGGDMYLAHKVNENESIVGVFDVSGKNVAASLLTMTVPSFFKTLKYLKKFPRSAMETVSMLDDFLANVVPPGNFITAILCWINVHTHRMYIFNCGHTTCYLTYQEPATGNPVKTAPIVPKLPPFGMGAIKEQLSKTENSKERSFLALEARRGIHLDFYSDGFTDMQNPDGRRYEEQSAFEFFTRLYTVPEEDFFNEVTKTVNKYIGEMLIPDDITIMDIRI